MWTEPNVSREEEEQPAPPERAAGSGEPPPLLDRRGFFSFARSGLGAAAFASLLLRGGHLEARRAAPGCYPGEADDLPPHVAPKAVRAVHVCLTGGLSQVDSFDHKPALAKLHGKALGSGERPDVFFGKVGPLRRNDWDFHRRGRSGLWISDLFPHLAMQADELTVINSMFAETANHTPATFQENTGFRLNGFPVLGSWLSWGMGAETDELPAYVVIPDARGYPAGGTINWTNGFLPARHQGVPFRARGSALDDLFPSRPLPAGAERASRELLDEINRRHHASRGSDFLAARMESYRLAARMQLAAPEVSDLEREPAATRELYGIGARDTDDFGRACLLARRLLERGVRFVQLFSGGSFGSPRINWDGHEDMVENHSQEARRIDRPVAALLADLRRRGMLDDTLVLFTTEFGRTPFTQSDAGVLGTGRDHNQHGFSVWLAGAGMKPGIAHGSTDEIGWKAVEGRVHWHDFHATVLHLLGIDHERLTYYHNGIRRRLTNVHGRVLREILA
jgi:hypothetical protein